MKSILFFISLLIDSIITLYASYQACLWFYKKILLRVANKKIDEINEVTEDKRNLIKKKYDVSADKIPNKSPSNSMQFYISTGLFAIFIIITLIFVFKKWSLLIGTTLLKIALCFASYMFLKAQINVRKHGSHTNDDFEFGKFGYFKENEKIKTQMLASKVLLGTSIVLYVFCVIMYTYTNKKKNKK